MKPPAPVAVETLVPDATALVALNRVVEDAVMGWDLAERVKRLALPGYRYTDLDARHLTFVVARDAGLRIVGVAAWEPADQDDAPPGRSAALLHGLFVAPGHQGRGIGGRLLEQVLQQVSGAAFEGLLVRAQRDAASFFIGRGFIEPAANTAGVRYPHSLWYPLR